VLDTWFSSALWPFATLGWPAQTPALARLLPDRRARHRPRDHLPLGRADDHDGARIRGEVPFHDVYITSVIQAPDGRRMSKSLGTGVDPLTEIDR
jgi:valyl-tRNA synthetase